MEFNSLQIQGVFNLPNWKRVSVDDHETHRFEWVRETIANYASKGDRLIDVGCGRQPFRSYIETLQIHYTGHDFSGYREPDCGSFGLHNIEVPSGRIDIVCDILDIDTNQQFDIVLCTEVLEHVPDPVKALEKIRGLIAPGGVAILTFPGLSWTHQAPFYFSSGLSPYWVNHHAREMRMEVVEGFAVGDMRDLLKFLMPNYEIGYSGVFLRLLGYLYRLLAKRKRRINLVANDSAILQNLVVLRCE